MRARCLSAIEMNYRRTISERRSIVDNKRIPMKRIDRFSPYLLVREDGCVYSKSVRLLTPRLKYRPTIIIVSIAVDRYHPFRVSCGLASYWSFDTLEHRLSRYLNFNQIRYLFFFFFSTFSIEGIIPYNFLTHVYTKHVYNNCTARRFTFRRNNKITTWNRFEITSGIPGRECSRSVTEIRPKIFATFKDRKSDLYACPRLRSYRVNSKVTYQE